MATQWAYKSVERNSTNLHLLEQDLNLWGQQGWEMVGFAGADKTLGLNSVMAILKKPVEGPKIACDISGWTAEGLITACRELHAVGVDYQVVEQQLWINKSDERVGQAVLQKLSLA